MDVQNAVLTNSRPNLQTFIRPVGLKNSESRRKIHEVNILDTCDKQDTAAVAEAKARHEALYGRLAAANSQVLEHLPDLP